jgi:2-polyprenyl-6-methoxyphenol hydroxylase-like FAD-dependent oxidoreductase
MTIEPGLLGEFTTFPYMVEISQWKVEALLGKLLNEKNISVYRPFRVVDMKAVEDSSSPWKFNVSFEGGQRILAKYVVAADGSRSIVRFKPGVLIVTDAMD